MIDEFLIDKTVFWRKPRALRTLVILGLLTGCTVGPDFQAPSPPDVPLAPRLIATPSPPVCAAIRADVQDMRLKRSCMSQRLEYGRDIPGEWWTLFRSRPLGDLMERALRDNHDLKAAQAALRAAHANYEAQRGAFFPVVNAGYLPSKQKVATRDFSSPTWSELPFHTAQLTVSYVPDVFGGTRRLVEVSSAQEEMQQFLLEATYLTLTSSQKYSKFQHQPMCVN
jgi:outer membrane protein TolC